MFTTGYINRNVSIILMARDPQANDTEIEILGNNSKPEERAQGTDFDLVML